jgi:hypothetical protein
MAPRRTCCVANLCVVLIASSSKETTRRQMIAKHLFPPAVKLSRSRHKHVANVKQHKRARLARPPSVDTRASEQPFFAQNLVNTKICRKLGTNKKWQRQQKKCPGNFSSVDTLAASCCWWTKMQNGVAIYWGYISYCIRDGGCCSLQSSPLYIHTRSLSHSRRVS